MENGVNENMFSLFLESNEHEKYGNQLCLHRCFATDHSREDCAHITVVRWRKVCDFLEISRDGSSSTMSGEKEFGFER